MQSRTTAEIDAYQEDIPIESHPEVLREVKAEAAARYNGHQEAVEKAHAIDYCGKGSIVIAITSNQRIAVVPIRCKCWRCPTCGPILGKVWAHRIEGAKPQRFITLTGDPGWHQTPATTYDAMKEALPIMVRKLRAEGIRFEYVAVWELHKSGFPHLHLMQKGDYVPWKLMKSIWEQLKIGSHVHIETVDDVKRAAFYVAKYISKAVATLHTGLKVTKTIQVSKRFFETRLIKKANEGRRCEGVIRTRMHMAAVVDLLVTHHGFEIVAVEGSAAFGLAPPARMTWLETLALLQNVI
jgi:hypothetical protein